MSGKGHVHAIVNVLPFRMVIHFFCENRNLAHERPRLFKVSKLKSFGNGVLSRRVLLEERSIVNTSDTLTHKKDTSTHRFPRKGTS